jgi:hypothetical protein
MPGTVMSRRHRIRSDPLPHRLVEDGDLLPQLPPGGEKRTHNQSDLRNAFKQGLDFPVKSKPATRAGQQTEGLQNAAYHVGQLRRHADELSPSAEESSCAVRIEGLHVHCPIPSRAHDLRQPLSIVLVGLVQPHLQCDLHLPGIQTLDVKAGAAQPMNEPGRHRAGLDTYLGVDSCILQTASRDRPDQ